MRTRRMVRNLAILFAAITASAASLRPAPAQEYPTRPIHMIAPYAPGGIADIAARLVGAKLTEAWGQQVVVENRPGANGFIGVTAVSRAAPDGYTLLVATVGDVAINPVLFKSVPYDVGRDLVSITRLSDTPTVLATNGASHYRTVADVLKDAKARPGEIAIASPGIGSINQLAFESMGLETGTKFLHVPYKGGAPAAIFRSACSRSPRSTRSCRATASACLPSPPRNARASIPNGRPCRKAAFPTSTSPTGPC